MPLYEIGHDGLRPVKLKTFKNLNLYERADLQRLLRDNIDVVDPETLIISEEYSEWRDSQRRIDLLGIDRNANIVVIELKRTEDGGLMDLQAIRYAAMVSTMTFENAVTAFTSYLTKVGRHDTDARITLLEHLGWAEPDHDKFGQDVRIVLASANFSPELTTAALWLNERSLDIRCVRIQPYSVAAKLILDVQQIIPLPDAADYQVRVREKVRVEREARSGAVDRQRYILTLGTALFEDVPKGRVVLKTVRYLAQNGIKPDDIATQCGPRAQKRFFWVEGHADAVTFRDLAVQSLAGSNKLFDSSRWFCGDDELLHVGSRTYALTNQWGGQDWKEAMNNLCDAYSNFGIKYEALAKSSAQ